MAILAAGRGSRLAPLTDDRPKCLLSIDDVSPLACMLETLDRQPTVAEVLIVVGHAAERVEQFLEGRSFRFATTLVHNPRFDSANNIYSAKLLGERCADGLLLVNSDVLCDPAIVAAALDEADGSFLVVDESRPIRGEAMKVRLAAGRLAAIGKELDPDTSDGEYIGLARFDAAGAAAFFTAVDAILADGGDGEWYEAAIGNAARTIAIGSRAIGGRAWIEIDDFDDLARARDVVLPRIRGASLVGFASRDS